MVFYLSLLIINVLGAGALLAYTFYIIGLVLPLFSSKSVALKKV